MTEKQSIILHTALRLFATDGVDATPTSKIAREAGVSEGLIFRHFGNKEGLLDAVMHLGFDRATALISRVASVADPKERIHAFLRLPAEVPQEDHAFWRLTYALKWQRGVYFDAFEQLQPQLCADFAALGYPDPENQVRLLEVLLDGLATEGLLRGTEHLEALTALLLKNYSH